MRLASERLVAFEGQRGFMASPLSLEDLNDLCALRIDLSCRALRESSRGAGRTGRTKSLSRSTAWSAAPCRRPMTTRPPSTNGSAGTTASTPA